MNKLKPLAGVLLSTLLAATYLHADAPDWTENPPAALFDINNNGALFYGHDVNHMLNDFGTSDMDADLNCDGNVNIDDLNILREYYARYDMSRYDPNTPTDNRVTGADAQIITDFVGIHGVTYDTDPHFIAGYDVNRDGKISSTDALWIVNSLGKSPWQNPDNILDINGVDGVTAADILVMANFFNETTLGPLGGVADKRSGPYYDVNGDKELSSLDFHILVENWTTEVDPPLEPPVPDPLASVATASFDTNNNGIAFYGHDAARLLSNLGTSDMDSDLDDDGDVDLDDLHLLRLFYERYDMSRYDPNVSQDNRVTSADAQLIVDFLDIHGTTCSGAPNFIAGFDVSNDGCISSVDALWIINALGRSPWQNQNDVLDINGDGDVTSLDLLVMSNFFNETTIGPLAGVADKSGGPFYDVNGDKELSGLDFLILVNNWNTAN